MIKRKYFITLYLCVLVGFFSSTHLARAEGSKVDIASISGFQYSAIIVYSENIQDQLDKPENSQKNFTTYITIEANMEILATIIVIISPFGYSLVYTLNDPQSLTSSWSDGDSGIHVKQLDSTSVQLNLLEIAMISTSTPFIFKAYATFDEGGIDEYKQNIGTFLQWYYTDFVVSSNMEESSTSSSTNTTISETISNSTNGDNNDGKTLSIASFPTSFLIASSIPTIILVIWAKKKDALK